MNEKSKKAAGKAFLALTAVIALAAMIFSVYMGGQKKVVEKFYNSLVRSDGEGVSSCYSQDCSIAGTILQEMSDNLYRADAGFLEKDGGIVHVRVNFLEREMTDISECAYHYTVTYYNDDSDSFTTSPKRAVLVRRGLGWRIVSPQDPPEPKDYYIGINRAPAANS